MTITTSRRLEPLVGREGELAALERSLDGLRTPGVRVLAIRGEPGIGKTRLLAELADRAGARGLPVLHGRALEFESAVPFAPVVDALDPYLAVLDARRPVRLDREQLAELSAVFPSLADRPGAEPPALPAERYRLHRAVCALLAALADRRPLVVLLDDLHWADESSLELVAHLLRRPPAARVLLALAYRPRQAPMRLIGMLDHATRGGAPVDEVDLVPLSEAQTVELLAGRGLDPVRCRAIHAAGGGNPFYAEQLSRTGEASDLHAPATVAAAIAQEAAALGPAAARLLLAAAVAGDPFDAALAAAIAELDADAASALLDELAARDLVRPTEHPARLAFRHPIVRAAIYARAPAGARRAAHARAAAALQDRGAPASAVAQHLERCARPGDAAAARALVAAADEAMARAPASAARWYEAALALQPAGLARHALLVALARALAAAGRLEHARERIEEALETTPATAADANQLVALCAGLDQLLGRHAEAHARLVAALERLPAEASSARLALQSELALQPGYAYDASPHSHRAAQALADAQLDDPGDEAVVQATLAVRATLLGQIPEAQTRAARAGELLDALDDHRLAVRLEAAHRLGGAELHLNRYEPAARHLARGVALARATGQGRFLIPTLAHLGATQAALGQLAIARRSSEDALDTARLTGPASLRLWALIYAVQVELHAGDLHAAHALARDAHRLADQLPPSSFTAKAHALLATTTLELGDPERALALFDRSGTGDVQQHEAPVRSVFWEPLVRARLTLDHGDDVRRLLEAIDTAVAALDLPLPRVHAHRAHAHALLAAGDPAAAARHARLAAAEADTAHAIVDGARARLLAATALAAAGDTAAALAELRHAHRTLAGCGADGHRDHAARLLRRLGQPVKRPGRDPDPGAARRLSDREDQIARLVADGLTNQQIADRLHISPKTVEMHLTRAYAKLGITHRSALARLLADAQPHR